MGFKGKRIIVGKLGLDAHDNGLRVISRWLMDDGYEVIYAGLYNSTDRILKMCIQEHADAIGISFLGGEHLFYAEQLTQGLRQSELGHVKLILGGVIPQEDVVRLKMVGVHAVFTPGTRKQVILDEIGTLFT